MLADDTQCLSTAVAELPGGRASRSGGKMFESVTAGRWSGVEQLSHREICRWRADPQRH
jgi:hypothetical protein